MKTYFYKDYDFTAKNYQEAEKIVTAEFGYCDHDELFEGEAWKGFFFLYIVS